MERSHKREKVLLSQVGGEERRYRRTFLGNPAWVRIQELIRDAGGRYGRIKMWEGKKKESRAAQVREMQYHNESSQNFRRDQLTCGGSFENLKERA